MPAYTNARPCVPELFKEILRNDAVLQSMVCGVPEISAEFREEWKTRRERKLELIRHAEKTLRWNTDKGN